MPFIRIPNTALFKVIFALGSTKRAQFGVYVRNDVTPWGATQLTVKAGEIRDAVIADYVPALSSDHDYLGIIGQNLDVPLGRTEEVFEGAAVPGTLVSASLPWNVAVVATLKSAEGAPRRGRWFFMPPAENQVEGNTLNVGAQGDLQAAAEAIHAAADAGASNSVVIASRYSGTHLDDEAPHGQTLLRPTARAVGATQPIASVQVRSRTDSQRKRLSAEAA